MNFQNYIYSFDYICYVIVPTNTFGPLVLWYHSLSGVGTYCLFEIISYFFMLNIEFARVMLGDVLGDVLLELFLSLLVERTCRLDLDDHEGGMM